MRERVTSRKPVDGAHVSHAFRVKGGRAPRTAGMWTHSYDHTIDPRTSSVQHPHYLPPRLTDHERGTSKRAITGTAVLRKSKAQRASTTWTVKAAIWCGSASCMSCPSSRAIAPTWQSCGCGYGRTPGQTIQIPAGRDRSSGHTSLQNHRHIATMRSADFECRRTVGGTRRRVVPGAPRPGWHSCSRDRIRQSSSVQFGLVSA